MKINNLILGLTTVGIIGGLIPGIPVHASTISSFKLKLHLVDKATRKQIHNDVVVDVNRDFDGWYYFEVPKIDGYIPEFGLYIRSVPGPTSDTTSSNSNVLPESTTEYDTYETSLSKNAVPPKTSHWSQLGNTWYYVNSTGTYTKGWKEIGEKWYFLDKTTGAMKTGWVKDGDTWYYMWSDGSMATNTTIGGYYVNQNGAWIQNQNNISTINSSGSKSNTITAQEARQLILKEDGNYISKFPNTKLLNSYNKEYTSENMPFAKDFNIPREPVYEFGLCYLNENGEIDSDQCTYLVGKETKNVYVIPHEGTRPIYQIKNNQKVKTFKWPYAGQSIEWH